MPSTLVGTKGNKMNKIVDSCPGKLSLVSIYIAELCKVAQLTVALLNTKNAIIQLLEHTWVL